jgi:glycogenin glucosyltransferase
VFAQSLRDTKTKHKIIVLVTSNIPTHRRKELELFFDEVVEVEPIENPWPSEAMVRQNFAFTLTKLRIWQQTKFTKVVFFDADVIVLKNVDELFEYEELSAVHDCCEFFNSGMMVVTPSNQTFDDMMKKTRLTRSHDGGDQGFLNVYFSQWNRVPFFYNALITTALDKNYRGAFRFQEDKIKVLHYMDYKPWHPLPQKGLDERAVADLIRLHSHWHTVHERVKLREKSEI